MKANFQLPFSLFALLFCAKKRLSDVLFWSLHSLWSFHTTPPLLARFILICSNVRCKKVRSVINESIKKDTPIAREYDIVFYQPTIFILWIILMKFQYLDI